MGLNVFYRCFPSTPFPFSQITPIVSFSPLTKSVQCGGQVLEWSLAVQWCFVSCDLQCDPGDCLSCVRSDISHLPCVKSSSITRADVTAEVIQTAHPFASCPARTARGEGHTDAAEILFSSCSVKSVFCGSFFVYCAKQGVEVELQNSACNSSPYMFPALKVFKADPAPSRLHRLTGSCAILLSPFVGHSNE